MKKDSKKPILILIRDGWGYRKSKTKNAIAQANLLSNMGMSEEDVVTYATRLAVDQICYGSLRDRMLEGKLSTYDAVKAIAASQHLLPEKEAAKSFRKDAK